MRSTTLCIALALAACNAGPLALGTADQPSLTAPTTIAPTDGFGDPTTTVTIDAAGNVHWLGGDWYVPLPVSAGDVIGSISAIVQDNAGTSGNTIIESLVMRLPAPTGDTEIARAWTNESGAVTTLTVTPNAPYTVPAGAEMLAKFHAMGNNLQPATVPSMTGAVTVGPGAPPGPPVRTLVIPVGPVGTSGRLVAYYASVTGLDSDPTTAPQDVWVPIALPVGSTIRALRLREQSPSGTQLQFALMSEADGSETLASLAASPLSVTSSAPQTVTIGSLAIAIAGSTSYIVKAYNAVGIFNSFVFRLEVDYN